MVGRFGAMPGRGPGLSSVVGVHRAAAGLARRADRTGSSRPCWPRAGSRRRRPAVAGRRVGGFTRLVEDDARRRIAEEKGARPRRRRGRPARASTGSTSPSARRADLEEMRREIYPLARRLATRLTQEQHASRRGPLDFRRTVRASISTGGVPLTTHHRPKRPHRTELVVLCDVSGSVANFAQFTLLLVFALREQFQKRAGVHLRRPRARGDRRTSARAPTSCEVMADLAASTAQAALWGRTNYGRAFTHVRRGVPRRARARSRRCWSSATPAPTTATSRCRC